MTRVLMIETASPKRVREKAKEILAGNLYPSPELTILCRPDPRSVELYGAMSGLRVIALEKSRKSEILTELGPKPFDVVLMFWTRDRGFSRMKWLALRLRASRREVDIGDGHMLRLSPGNFARFLLIRCRYPRPSDYDLFAYRAARLHQGEEVLIIQSAGAPHVLRVLDHLKTGGLFRDPRYTLFCRNREEVVRPLRGHPMIERIITHSETRGAWRHLRDLRREHFDAVVVLFTGDPSYWKIKYFAFLLGARHKVIFNENDDCFYFSWGAWLSLLAYRIGARSRLGSQPRWTHRVRFFAVCLLKTLFFPLRFAWLLLVWLRLRSSGLGTSD